MEADDKDLLINDLHYGQGPFSDSSLKRRSASFDAAFSKKRRGLLKMKKKSAERDLRSTQNHLSSIRYCSKRQAESGSGIGDYNNFYCFYLI